MIEALCNEHQIKLLKVQIVDISYYQSIVRPLDFVRPTFHQLCTIAICLPVMIHELPLPIQPISWYEDCSFSGITTNYVV